MSCNDKTIRQYSSVLGSDYMGKTCSPLLLGFRPDGGSFRING